MCRVTCLEWARACAFFSSAFAPHEDGTNHKNLLEVFYFKLFSCNTLIDLDCKFQLGYLRIEFLKYSAKKTRYFSKNLVELKII